MGKIVPKNCEFCGKKFGAVKVSQKYCGKRCRLNAANYRCPKRLKPKRKYGQICWYCKKACGKCSWSRELKPVEGWEPEVVLLEDYIHTRYYFVRNLTKTKGGK